MVNGKEKAKPMDMAVAPVHVTTHAQLVHLLNSRIERLGVHAIMAPWQGTLATGRHYNLLVNVLPKTFVALPTRITSVM